MTRIIVILKEKLEYRRPLVNCLEVFANLGRKFVVIVESCDDSTIETYHDLGIDIHRYQQVPWPKTKNPFLKIRRWLAFRRYAWTTYQKMKESDDILWVGSADTTLALGKKLLSYKYVLHIHELYDTFPRYRNGLRIFAKSATAIVVPDTSRAAIFRVWWNLSTTPFVVPNKPFHHPRKPKIEIFDANVEKQIAEIGNEPIILYQGHIEAGRNLDVVAKAIHNLSFPIRLVLMGRDHGNFVGHLKTLCPNLVSIGFVTPPHHLEVTSYATIGIIQYDFSCLNHIFCAPNKIWEYSGFGIPTLAADLPSLRYYLDRFHGGICCNFDSEDDVTEAIGQIIQNREFYMSGAMALYDSWDLIELYQIILEKMER